MAADRTKWPRMLRCMNRILTDDLLLEIFYRLPSAELVTRCKCVCKRWCHLISSPDFVPRFIAHKLHHRSWISSNTIVGGPSAFFIKSYIKDHNDIVYPVNHPFTPPRSSPGFIPCHNNDASKESLLLDRAFCGDLVLCDNWCSEEPDLYICNPRTKQWFQLPSPPPPPCTEIAEKREGRCMPGLICDPYFCYNKTGNISVSLNSCYRYSVCFVFPEGYDPRTRLNMQIFSSETSSWRNVILLSPEKFNFLEGARNGWVTYNGMLLLYHLDSLICFDPYKVTKDDYGVNVIHGHFIRMPPFALNRPQCIPNLCLGVFRERILIVQYCACHVRRREEMRSIAEVDYNFKIWELKNYDTGEWLLERTVFVRDLVSGDYTLDQHIKMQFPNTVVIYFHPYDPDIVLLGTFTFQPNQIVECNLREKTLKTVCNIDRWRISTIFTHNWWPTPVPHNL